MKDSAVIHLIGSKCFFEFLNPSLQEFNGIGKFFEFSFVTLDTLSAFHALIDKRYHFPIQPIYFSPEQVDLICASGYRSKQRTNIVSRNYTMFGAALDRKSEFRDGNAIWAELDACQGETDLVSDLFRELEQQEQIVYPFNIWLKFDGEADHRLEATDPFPMTDFDLPSGKVYLSNYPFRVSSIKEGDEVYFAGLTTSKNGRNLPVIIGRGRLTGFTGKNHVTDVMIAQYPWMQRFPWYVTISECDVLDAPLVEGIPLDEVWDALGSGTYLASFGRHESIPAVSRKHYQKAHIRLSGNAKQYIDKRLDTLFEQFGTIHYVSAT